MKKQYKPKKRWLEYVDASKPWKHKTKSFEVWNKETNEVIGFIKWSPGWRQFVFEDSSIRLAEGCLYELFEKVKATREEREKLRGSATRRKED